MIPVMFKKILRDMVTEKGRAVVVIVALFVGIFSAAMLSTSYVLLKRELKVNFLATNPESASIRCGRNGDFVVSALRSMPWIAGAENREKVVARFKTRTGRWIPAWLFVVEDFRTAEIGRIGLQRGAYPSSGSEIAFERATQKLIGASLEGDFSVKIPGGKERTFTATGVIFDPGLAPAWMEGIVYGYITRDGLFHLGAAGGGSDVKIIIRENNDDLGVIRAGVERTMRGLADRGIPVLSKEIPLPGAHPHEGQMDSLMFLLFAFGVLTLVLSGILVVNMLSALMARQMRQIGVMKASGAGSFRIAVLYISFVAVLGMTAAAGAVPAGMPAGIGYSRFVAGMLNFNIYSESLPFFVYGFQLLMALLIPVAVSFVPIVKSSRVSVRQCLNDYGVDEKRNAGQGLLEAAAARVSLSPFVAMAARNSLRRKGRLVLTLFTLVMGGVLFISAFNLRESINTLISVAFGRMNADVMVYYDAPGDPEVLKTVFTGVDGIARVEMFRSVKGTVTGGDGHESNQVDISAFHPRSVLSRFDMVEGDALAEGEEGSVVLNNSLAAKSGGVHAGDSIYVKVPGGPARLRVKGIVRQPFRPPTVYADWNFLKKRTGNGFVEGTAVFLDGRRPAGDIVRKIEEGMERQGIAVRMIVEKSGYRILVVEHLRVITAMLIMMTFLVIIVGGLGLVASMSINVMDRTREIGILRALGMNDRGLYRMVMIEGLMTGFASWIAAVVLSLPASLFLGNRFTQIFFQTNIDYAVSAAGIFLWGAVLFIFIIAATRFPARAAARMSVSRALAFD